MSGPAKHTQNPRAILQQNSIYCPLYWIHPNIGALYLIICPVFIRVHCLEHLQRRAQLIQLMTSRNTIVFQ